MNDLEIYISHIKPLIEVTSRVDSKVEQLLNRSDVTDKKIEEMIKEIERINGRVLIMENNGFKNVVEDYKNRIKILEDKQNHSDTVNKFVTKFGESIVAITIGVGTVLILWWFGVK